MELTAVFESWHVGDGNYPPLQRHQLVRLSFELHPRRLLGVVGDTTPLLQHRGDAEYAGRGMVLRRYGDPETPIAVIETGAFRFFISAPEAEALVPGALIEFEGTLFLDHYVWVEFLDRYADPPDLFYNLRVTRIRKVQIPDHFIKRSTKGKALPTHVGPADFGTVEDLDTMAGQPFEEEFYVVDFDGKGLEGVEIPKTFQ